MKNLVTILLVSAALSAAASQLSAPKPILPDSMKYSSTSVVLGAELAQLVGEPQKTGPYLVRVKLAAGTKIPPHTHPDERNSTVLAGTIYVGFGDTFDESQVVAIPTGAVYVAPAGVPHYIWAKDGPALYQEAGSGPTATYVIGK